MPHHEIHSCPICGQEFECKAGSISICHCSEVQLSREQNEFIRMHWEECLCHDCLIRISKMSLPSNQSVGWHLKTTVDSSGSFQGCTISAQEV